MNKLMQMGGLVVTSSAEQLAAYIKTGISKNARIIKAADVEVEGPGVTANSNGKGRICNSHS